MNPFFFGTAERRLFGIYEPAAVGTAGKRAAILCYPWGAEYLHAHRTLRQLALKLSSAGFHTLRFDFYGTGDSGGEPTDVDLAGWEADLETAIEELTEITGLSKVTLIGLRLGAVVAAECRGAAPQQDRSARAVGSGRFRARISGRARCDAGRSAAHRGARLPADRAHAARRSPHST